MLHPHKLEGEVLGQGILLPVFQGKKLVIHPEFLFTCYLLPYQLNRVGCPDDRCIVPVGQFRNSPDVIQVAVRADDRFHAPFHSIHHRVIRNCLHLDKIQ